MTLAPMRSLTRLLLAGVFTIGSVTAAWAVQMHIPSGDYARQLGGGTLDDPSGAPHTRRDAEGQVIVAIFSIPNMSQGGYQEKWAKLLADQSDQAS